MFSTFCQFDKLAYFFDFQRKNAIIIMSLLLIKPKNYVQKMQLVDETFWL